jgi:hypothetical protein
MRGGVTIEGRRRLEGTGAGSGALDDRSRAAASTARDTDDPYGGRLFVITRGGP